MQPSNMHLASQLGTGLPFPMAPLLPLCVGCCPWLETPQEIFTDQNRGSHHHSFFLFNSRKAVIAPLVKDVEMLNLKSIASLKSFTFLELQGEMKECF